VDRHERISRSADTYRKCVSADKFVLSKTHNCLSRLHTEYSPDGGETIWPARLYPIHTATPDPTKQSCLRPVCLGGVNWIPDNSRLSPTGSLKSEHANSNCPIHSATPGTIQTGLSCRIWCGGVNRVGPTGRQVRSVSDLRRSASGGRTAAATQASQAARPSRQTATQNVNTLWA